MPRSRVSSVVRRAVLLQLSLAAPGLLACSGSSGESTLRDASTGASDAADASGEAAPCSVIPNTPPAYSTGSCYWADYAFEGTSAECGGDGGLAIPLAVCETLCPPVGADAGFSPSETLSVCTLETFLDGFHPAHVRL